MRYFLPQGRKTFYDKYYHYGKFILFLIVLTGIFSIVVSSLSQLIIFPLVALYKVHWGLTVIPLILSLIPVYLFLNKDFTKKPTKPTKNKTKKNTVLHTKNQIKFIKPASVKITDPIVDKAVQLLKRLNEGENFVKEDQYILTELETTIKDMDAQLCDADDFYIDDKYCKECNEYSNCLINHISDKVQK